MPRLPLLSALTIALALPVASNAQVHKCVDPATGKTTYLQSPCPSNTRAATLKKTAPAASPAPSRGDSAKAGDAKASGPKTTADLERDFRKRKQDQEEVRKKEDEKLAQAKVKEENCTRARQQLVTLESGTRQARIDAKGERYFLEDAQIEQEKSRTRAAIEQWCK